MVDEADAIATAYVRARFFSEPHRSTIGDLLRKYVDLRLASAESGRSIAELSSIEAETARLRAQLWDLTIAATEQNQVNMPGYSSGLHGGRVRHTIVALCRLVGVVMLFILDLDQPTRGLIRDSQESMIDVRASMQRASHR